MAFFVLTLTKRTQLNQRWKLKYWTCRTEYHPMHTVPSKKGEHMLQRDYDIDEGPQREVHSPKDLGTNHEISEAGYQRMLAVDTS
jgi:hypothetical protein